MDRAGQSSLPVPVGPSRSTVVGEAATTRARSITRRSVALEPTIASNAAGTVVPLQVPVLGRQALVGRLELLDQTGVLVGQATIALSQEERLDGLPDHRPQLVRVERLRDVAQDAAQIDRADQRLDVGVPGEDERDQVGPDLASARDDLDPGHARHALIRDQDADLVLPQDLEGFGAAQGGVKREVASVVELEELEHVGLVVDDEHRTRAMVDCL